MSSAVVAVGRFLDPSNGGVIFVGDVFGMVDEEMVLNVSVELLCGKYIPLEGIEWPSIGGRVFIWMFGGIRLEPRVPEASDAMPGELLTLECRSSVGLVIKSWLSGIVLMLGKSAGNPPLTLEYGTSIIKSEPSLEYTDIIF